MKKAYLVLLFLTAFLFTFIKVRGFDLFFYLKVADFETLFSPLKTNFFSFTFPDFPYRNYAHLFSEGVNFVAKHFGINLLTILQSLIVALSYLIIAKASYRKIDFIPFFSALLLSIFTLRYRLLFRPHNLSYIFFALNIYLLVSRPRHFRLFLFLNQMLWVNTHNGFILGIVNLLLLYPYNRQLRIDLHKTVLALLAGSLASPHLYHPFLEVINPFWGSTKNIFQYIKVHEWQATDGRLYFSFYGILILYSGYIVLREKKFRLIPFYLFYLALSVRFVRFVDFFALVAFFVIITGKKGYIFVIEKGHKAIKTLAFAILLFFCLNDYTSNPIIPYGYGLAEYFYPKGSVNYLKAHNIRGNAFNSYAFGGYLIYEMFPHIKPAIDGRLCYPLDFIALYARSHEDKKSFLELVNKFSPHIFLIDFEHPQLGLFITELKERYALVYFDDTAMLFLDRAMFKDVVQKDEIRYLNPLYVSGYDNDEVPNEMVKLELERQIKKNPSNRALIMYANLLLKENRKDDAKAVLQLVSQNKNPIGKTECYNNLGTISLNEGNIKYAKTLYKKALRFSDDLATAHFNLAQIYDEEKNYPMAYYHYKKFVKLSEDNVPSYVFERLEVLKRLSLFLLARLFIAIFAISGLYYILYWKRRKTKH